jgi:hypothetical protein
MAKKGKKKKKQSAPAVQTVTAPTAGEMIGAASKGTSKLAGSAATGNVQGAMTSLAGQGTLLQSEGAFALNPALKAEWDSLKKAENTLVNLRADLQALQEKGDTGGGGWWKYGGGGSASKLQEEIAKNEAIVAKIKPKIESAPKFTDLLKEKFPELAQQLVESQPFLDQMGKLGPQGEAMMAALQGGFQGSDISWNNAQAVGSSGAQLGASPTAVANQAGYTQGPQAAQASSGALGESLMNRAIAGVESGGRLNAEASRDAVQAARQGFAARGMATSGAAMAAELLNRDRYSRQRELQDLQFAGQTQSADVARRQFNAGNEQAANMAAYQGDINQGQFNAAQANTIGMANLDLAGRYGLAQGQMTQQNNQFNAAQQAQNNQFNATGQYNAMGAQADNNRLNFGANVSALQGAYGLGQSVLQGGLAAAGIKSGLAGAANPNATMLNMYGSAQPVGSQAMGPATSMANTWATNQLGANMFNANANNWASGQQWMMKNTPSIGNPFLTGSAGGDFALNTGMKIGERLLFG